MAMTRRLGEGWTLTDGVLDPFLISRPMEVNQALQAQGLLPKQAGGSELTALEWTRLRRFTYACKFDAPEEDDELLSLHIPLVSGSGWIKLNGHTCWRFERAAVYFPIPNELKERGNLLEITFDPDPLGNPRGIISDAFLRTGNYLRLNASRFDGRGETITARHFVTAYSSGKYLFKYTVALDGKAVLNQEFIERLVALKESEPCCHELNIPGAVRWDPANPEDTAYTVKLSIERMGVGCEQVVADVAMLPAGYEPKRIVHLEPELLAPGELRERTLASLRDLGAEAVAVYNVPGPWYERSRPLTPRDEIDPPALLFLENLLAYGLLSIDSDAVEARDLPVFQALAPLDTLQRLGGDWAFWPTDKPLYRWFGVHPLDVEAYEARFGVNAAGDAGRCIRLSRMLQAEQLYHATCEARLTGYPMLLSRPIEYEASPADTVLIEADGTQRPACQSIEDAWAAQCAYARLPEDMAAVCGSEIEVPVFLMTDRNGRALSVTASAFGQDEKHKLAQQTFEGSENGELGRLKFTMPSETQALTVRCEIQSGGSLLWRHDSVLCAHKEGEAPMAAMMKM